MEKPKIFIQASSPPPCDIRFRPQLLLSPKSGGYYKHVQRETRIVFERNGTTETVRLDVVDVGGLAWAAISLNGHKIAAHLIVGIAALDSSSQLSDNGSFASQTSNDDWLKDILRAMDLTSELNHWFSTQRSDAIQVPVVGGHCTLELALRRVTLETPSTPQSGSECSFLLLLKSDERVLLAQIL
ncbi:hypothetical protein LX32DRAFT_214227 [Colletotrichum zoysiae]|uniref:Uncharacterized protein n=1 Tax=Colletotrichum zoysiae TaxID=1216348 RepID=A0AAD9H5A4_9PEZI|nr:hypothetical protein LX32DRAFT_214227 [Colletotrichum zoysiae]